MQRHACGPKYNHEHGSRLQYRKLLTIAFAQEFGHDSVHGSVSPPARGKAKAGILRAVTSAEAFLPLGRGPVPPDFRERDSERFLPGLQPGPLLGSGVGRELLPKS